ncbi:MAG TPA: DEAD/DEAH box helicase, partial [Treponemataceae bacterium]|nr:DEAD/DEAH box helicase [Treponemataceae bacterium]
MLDSDAQSNPLLPLQQRLVERLPFSLTDDQVNCILEINADITGETPMARLLQGDVGSGKTLVSFMAALAVIEQGGQVALLAPTELLARQHAEGAATLLEVLGVRLAYLTGNVRASGRKELLTRLASGEIDVIVGTHALFSQKVQYKNLRLAIIDEQHRFGVRQRAAIQEKGMEGGNGIPHLL